jgi:hypothetical protein
MKADNSFKTTGDNRTIRITDLPAHLGLAGNTLDITINYIDHNDGGRLNNAVALDEFVIPRIMRGLNAKRKRKV